MKTLFRFRDEQGNNYPEWITDKLQNIAHIVMGQSPSSSAYSEDPNHGLVLVQGNADLKDGRITPRVYTSEYSKVSEPNDIIMTVRAPVGKIALTESKVCLGRGVCAIRTDNVFIKSYLSFLESSGAWDKISQGSTFTAVSSNDIRNISIKYPSSLMEQKKIAAFLSALDKNIDFHKQKLELLKKQKAGYMQKIFSRELRFRDEDGNEYPEWKNLVITDVYDIKSGSTKTKFVSNDGRYILVNMGAITEEGTLKQTRKVNIDYDLLDKEQLVMANRDIGTGLILGRVAYIDFNNLYALGDNVYKLTPKIDNLAGKYSFYYINNALRNFFAKNSQGSAQLAIAPRALSKAKFLLPSFAEQNKIVNFLNACDSNIELTRAKLVGLEKNKNLYSNLLIN